MDKLRLKYMLRVLITPGAWLRLGKTDKAWDNRLWEDLQSINNIQCIESHRAIINGNTVWVANYPYGSGSRKTREEGIDEVYCSRSTALFLQDQLKKALPLLYLKGITEDVATNAIIAKSSYMKDVYKKLNCIEHWQDVLNV